MTHEDVDREHLGGASVHTQISGVAHLAAPDEAAALDVARRILAHLPQNNLSEPPRRADQRPGRPSRRRPRHASCPMTRASPTTCTGSSTASSTTASFLELQPAWAANIIIGFARLDGRSVGIVAQQPAVLAGALDIDASDKAARFVRMCDAFNVPLLTLEDVPGFLPGVTQEHGGIIRHGAKLLYAYCEATVPKVTVITRKAYGGAYDVMSSKHVRGDVNLAWPTARIAVMGAEGAVKIIFRDELAAGRRPGGQAAAADRASTRTRSPTRMWPRAGDTSTTSSCPPRPGRGSSAPSGCSRASGDRNPSPEARQHPAVIARAASAMTAAGVFAQRHPAIAVAAGRRGDRARDQPPFRRLLIANRGEIAVRIIRACRELGIETVAVYSDADADALHVRAADQARPHRPGAGRRELPRRRRDRRGRARDRGRRHPSRVRLPVGAGAFAEAVEAAGIVFVGPAPATLAGLGDKIAARQSARANDVPIVPGTFEPIAVGGAGADASASRARPRDIGYPLLVKAAAGGGGRGMRRVDEPGELRGGRDRSGAARRCRRSGSASVYLEHYVEGGRHVEVQLLGDAHGDHRGARRARLLDPAPPPEAGGGGARTGPDARRAAAHPRARGPGRPVGRAAQRGDRGVPASRRHGDGVLPRGQRPAPGRARRDRAGERHRPGPRAALDRRRPAALRPGARGIRSAWPSPTRHAIELRISAEDPARAFAPTPGRIGRWREPAGPGVRVDSGVEEGMVVSGDYDPMLAKILVVAPTATAPSAGRGAPSRSWRPAASRPPLPFHAWLLRASGVRRGSTCAPTSSIATGTRRRCARRPPGGAIDAVARPCIGDRRPTSRDGRRRPRSPRGR